MWCQGVATNFKEEVKTRTRNGLIEGIPKAMKEIICDLENLEHWVQFNNGSVKTMTENLDYINLMEYCRDHFTSLEPFFAYIDLMQNTDGKYAATVV